MEFQKFGKIHRLSRDMVVTEKLDGTNASIHITEKGQFFVGSRTRFITPVEDNFGFAAWAYEHEEELRELGVGSHYGEWWGRKIQRGYGLEERRFSLFNTSRWNEETKPECCHVVPVLHTGVFSTSVVNSMLRYLHEKGSVASPGFMRPEGVVVYHTHSNTLFKKTLDHNDEHKFLHDDDALFFIE